MARCSRRWILPALLVAGAVACGPGATVEDGGVDAAPLPDASSRDVGPADVGLYDPVSGNVFDGAIDLSDERVAAVDPGSLNAPASPCRAPVLARITRVVDGDTVYANGISESLSTKVRLIGVDTPEVPHRGTPGDCYGAEATRFTAELVGRTVWLTFDRVCTDPYDRLLAYVWIGGGPQDLWERQLLRRGFATVLIIGRNDLFEAVFDQDEFIARREGLGLWSACR